MDHSATSSSQTATDQTPGNRRAGLPTNVHQKHGAFYYVELLYNRRRRWHFLTRDRSQIDAALAQFFGHSGAVRAEQVVPGARFVRPNGAAMIAVAKGKHFLMMSEDYRLLPFQPKSAGEWAGLMSRRGFRLSTKVSDDPAQAGANGSQT